jgi:hypothetical protein
VWQNCKYALMRGTGLCFTEDSTRAQSWKRRTQPRINLKNDEPVLYSSLKPLSLRRWLARTIGKEVSRSRLESRCRSLSLLTSTLCQRV